MRESVHAAVRPALAALGLLMSASTSAAGERSVFPAKVPDPTSIQREVRTVQVEQGGAEDLREPVYALRLRTEACLNGRCRPLDVILRWDGIGRYAGFSEPEGTPLTKNEHEPFTAEDRERLDRILRERNSALDGYTLQHLMEKDAGVDGYSGATPTEVREAIVGGAAYTTWVLWHWVHEVMPGPLRVRTAEWVAPEGLARTIACDDQEAIELALDLAAARFPGHSALGEAALAALPSMNGLAARQALAYLETSMPDRTQRLTRLAVALAAAGDWSARQILGALRSGAPLPEPVLAALSAGVDRMAPLAQVGALAVLEEHRGMRSEDRFRDNTESSMRQPPR